MGIDGLRLRSLQKTPSDEDDEGAEVGVQRPVLEARAPQPPRVERLPRLRRSVAHVGR